MGTAGTQTRAAPDGSGATSEGISDTFRYFGTLAGIAGMVFFVVALLTPSASSAQDQLASFQSDPNGYVLYLFPLGFAFLVTPFFLSLGSVLRSLGSFVGRPATWLILLGLFSLGIAGAFEYGGYWAVSVTPAPSLAIQSYEAALWSNINNAWEAVSNFGVAMGSLFLAWALRQTRELPRWMSNAAWIAAAIDLVGAVMASLSGYYSVLSVGFVLSIVPLIVFIVLSFTIPRAFQRSRAAPSNAPPSAV